MGELDNNLITNQSLVGKPLIEFSRQVVLEIEFYDYTMRPITPTQNIVVRDDTSGEYIITQEANAHLFGHAKAGDFNVNWQIVGNKMVLTAGRFQSEKEILNIFYFMLKELNASDKSYTKFKYIQ